jgi:23S rRNA (uridine2552-2'-O)-methyltransferase
MSRSTRSGLSGRVERVGLESGRRRKASSQRWLLRHLNDPYVQAAKREGYRSRAAFKLLELDARFRLFRPGAVVIDLGAAPGSWSEVAKRRGAERVIALDLLPIAPIPGVEILQGDFSDDAVMETLRAALGGTAAHLVLSDMAPNTTGHAATDHLRIMHLVALAADFASRVLAPGGAFVAKVFQGGTEPALLAELKQRFTRVRHAKPQASRAESAELYVIAEGFRGTKG